MHRLNQRLLDLMQQDDVQKIVSDTVNQVLGHQANEDFTNDIINKLKDRYKPIPKPLKFKQTKLF